MPGLGLPPGVRGRSIESWVDAIVARPFLSANLLAQHPRGHPELGT